MNSIVKKSHIHIRLDCREISLRYSAVSNFLFGSSVYVHLSTAEFTSQTLSLSN